MHSALLLAAGTFFAASSQANVVAVFAIEADRSGTPNASTLDGLGEYFRARLGATGAFRLVPSASLRAELVKLKRESFRACFDEKCQIEVGKAVAAQFALSTKVRRIAERCVFEGILFDLRTEISTKAATVEGSCDEESLARSVEELAAKLAETSNAEARKRRKEAGRAVAKKLEESLRAASFVDGGYRVKVVAQVDADACTLRIEQLGASIERPFDEYSVEHVGDLSVVERWGCSEPMGSVRSLGAVVASKPAVGTSRRERAGRATDKGAWRRSPCAASASCFRGVSVRAAQCEAIAAQLNALTPVCFAGP